MLQVQGDGEFQQKLRGAGGAFQNFGKQAESVNTQTEKIRPNMQNAALGLSAAASGAASLYFQYDNLEKSQLRVEKANKAQDKANLELSRSQEALSKLIADGTVQGVDYEQALQKVAIAEDNVRITTEGARIAQGDMNQAQIQFALSVLPTVFSAVTSATTALKGMNLAAITSHFNFGSLRTTSLTLIPALGGTTVAATATSFSLRGLALAIKGIWVAMGPIGWAILGIGAAFTAYETNVFGIKDALDGFAASFGATAEEAKTTEADISQTAVDMSTSFATANTDIAASLDSVDQKFKDTADKSEKEAERVKKAMEEMGLKPIDSTRTDKEQKHQLERQKPLSDSDRDAYAAQFRENEIRIQQFRDQGISTLSKKEQSTLGALIEEQGRISERMNQQNFLERELMKFEQGPTSEKQRIEMVIKLDDNLKVDSKKLPKNIEMLISRIT